MQAELLQDGAQVVGLLIWRMKYGVGSLIARQAGEKAEQKRKILEYFDLVADGRVKNDDVQKLCGVSDATATRYLEELEQEKLIKQIGDFGTYVYYEKRGK